MYLTTSLCAYFRRIHRINILFLAAILSLFLILQCSPPDSPFTPANTQVKLILKSSKNKVDNSYIEDSINTIVNIGAVFNLPEHIDSIKITIKNEQKILIKEEKLLLNTTNGSDTVWFQYFFMNPSKYTVECFGYIKTGITRNSDGYIQIYGLEVINHKPLITVTGPTSIISGETCNLTATVSDIDNNLTGAISMIKNPSGSQLSGTKFTWKTSAAYSGTDTVRFVVTDNGTPPLSDTATILIAVSSATVGSYSALDVSKYSTDTVSIIWKAIDNANQYYIYRTDKITGALVLVDSVKTPYYRDTIRHEIQSYIVKAATGQLVLWISDTLQTSKMIASDVTPPVFNFPSIIADSMTLTTSFFATIFTCKDSSGIKSVKCTVDTQPVLVTRLSDTAFLCSIYNLESGRSYSIHFSAQDNSFKANSRDTTFHVMPLYASKDTISPTIERILPEMDSIKTGQNSFTSQFKCLDNKGISSVVCTVGVRIITATKISDTVYSAIISGLAAGYNTIRATAFDTNGNKASLVFTINYDLSIGDITPPAIECRSPLGGSGSVNKAAALLEISSIDPL